MIKRIFVFFVLLFCLHTPVSQAQGLFPLFGVYVDSFTGISGKVGGGWAFSSLSEEDDSSFVFYTDLELGTKAAKITLGPAYATGYTFTRVGVSFSNKDSQNYIGIEGLHTVLILSFKFGVYEDPDSDKRIVTAGFGFGF